MPQRQPGKRPFTALLTDEAYARLDAFASDKAGDKVAFLEALCMHLEDKPLPRWLTDVVARDARTLAAERRRRAP